MTLRDDDFSANTSVYVITRDTKTVTNQSIYRKVYNLMGVSHSRNCVSQQVYSSAAYYRAYRPTCCQLYAQHKKITSWRMGTDLVATSHCERSGGQDEIWSCYDHSFTPSPRRNVPVDYISVLCAAILRTVTADTELAINGFLCCRLSACALTSHIQIFWRWERGSLSSSDGCSREIGVTKQGSRIFSGGGNGSGGC